MVWCPIGAPATWARLRPQRPTCRGMPSLGHSAQLIASDIQYYRADQAAAAVSESGDDGSSAELHRSNNDGLDSASRHLGGAFRHIGISVFSSRFFRYMDKKLS